MTRFRNAQALRELCHQYGALFIVNDEPILAKRPTALQRTVKWVRRNPTKSIVGAVVTLAFVAITAPLLQLSLERARTFQANAEASEERARTAEAEAARARERERARRSAASEPIAMNAPMAR